jgi:uncharacterized protein
MISIASAVLSVEPLDPSSILSGNPVVSSLVIHSKDNGDLTQGIWEITPGVVKDTEGDEIFVVHSGKAKIRVDDRYEYFVGPGSVGMFRAGAKTVWTVLETLRKAYSITKGPEDPPGPFDIDLLPCIASEALLNHPPTDHAMNTSLAPNSLPVMLSPASAAATSHRVLWQRFEPSGGASLARRRGILETAPGVALADGAEEEFFVVVAGAATLDVDGAAGPVAVGPGSVGVLPAGARARWTVHTPLRRVYETRCRTAAGPAAGPAGPADVAGAGPGGPVRPVQRSSL